MSGLLVNDISDHLPVFVIHDCDCERKNVETQGFVVLELLQFGIF